MVKKVFIFLSIIFLITLVSSQDFTHVISNSEDWRDVYSAILYANLNKAGSDFLVSTSHGPILLAGINKNNDIRIISSRRNPYIFNYESMVRNAGFRSAEEIIMNNANLELGNLVQVDNFIIVGQTYGYSAIAVAPYAVQSNSWVFFADNTNIIEIDNILSNKNFREIIIYGYVDRRVTETLSKYTPTIINSGDRFKDNIEIVERYLKLNPIKQAALTNGEFIEKELMSGVEPVLFTGRENVPDQIRDYIKSSDLEVGVLIGNELVGAATNIRRVTGMSVMVKFARGARTPGTGVSAVEGLDLFYIPRPLLQLEIHSIRYNRATSQLEVSYKSNSNTPGYLKGTITIDSDTGRERVGDLDPIFIAPDTYKTVVYPGISVSGENIFADVYTLYGETPTSLDRILEGRYNITIINVIDGCEMDFTKVKYNKQKRKLAVDVKNIGKVDCYVEIEIEDILINGIKRTIGSEGTQEIKPGKKSKIEINQVLDEEDLFDNQYVSLVGYYGEREEALVKVFRGRFELIVISLTFITYVIIALIILIIILIIIIILLRRREEEHY